MHSLQVRFIEPTKNWPNYSQLQILKSAAGFYIGTLYTDPTMDGLVEPGSRDSTYFVRKEIADRALAKLESFVSVHGEETGIAVWEAWLVKEDLDPHNVGYRFHP